MRSDNTLLPGLPFDHVVIYHRMCGRLALAMLAVHFGFYVKQWIASPYAMIYLTGAGAGLCGKALHHAPRHLATKLL